MKQKKHEPKGRDFFVQADRRNMKSRLIQKAKRTGKVSRTPGAPIKFKTVDA